MTKSITVLHSAFSFQYFYANVVESSCVAMALSGLTWTIFFAFNHFLAQSQI